MTYLDLGQLQPFRPSARYNHGMDVLTYRAEGGTCVAERVGVFLTLLWDKDRTRLVGIKLKGFRYVFNKLKDKYKLEECDFLPLVTVLEEMMTDGLGEEILAEQREKYELAKVCVRNYHLTRDDLRKVARAA